MRTGRAVVPSPPRSGVGGRGGVRVGRIGSDRGRDKGGDGEGKEYRGMMTIVKKHR